MNITLGVYDLFAYAAPGSGYLALVIYVADRLSWVDPLRLLQSNTAVVIISGAILSYLLGHITYRLGYILSRAYGHDKNFSQGSWELTRPIPSPAQFMSISHPKSEYLSRSWAASPRESVR